MVTMMLAIALWAAIGGRFGLIYAREDVKRNLPTCLGVGALAGAVFGAVLGLVWLTFVRLAGAPVG
ncbi:MAG: hypothetical protein ACKOJB_00335 [Chthoniobacterales bacterium]